MLHCCQSLLLIFSLSCVLLSRAQSNPPTQSQPRPAIDYTYLQDAFHNATDPVHYRHFYRPRGWCDGVATTSQETEKPLYLNMSLELYNYATVNEQNSEYTFQFFFDLEWCDERIVVPALRDNPAAADQYQFEGSRYHIDRLWHPSIFVVNNEDPGSIDYDQQSPNMIRIDLKSGRLFLRKRKLLRINCLMDFSLFPFDRQHCSVHFESNVENYANLVMRWAEVMIDKDAEEARRRPHSKRLLRATLQNDPTGTATTEAVVHSHGTFRTIGFKLVDIHLSSSIATGLSGVNFSRCTFDFTLQREYTHHIMISYLPSALIVIVAMTSFWLQIDTSPTRVLMAATTMLALVTNFKLTRDQLPSLSYLNVLDIWNLVCITFIALSWIEYTVVIFITNTPKRRAVMRRIKRAADKYKAQRTASMLAAEKAKQGHTELCPQNGQNHHLNFAFNGMRHCLINGKPPTPIEPGTKDCVILSLSEETNSESNTTGELTSLKSTAPDSRKASDCSTTEEEIYILGQTPEQLSHRIDYWCRFLFPGGFCLFNLLYWLAVFVSKANTDKPKW